MPSTYRHASDLPKVIPVFPLDGAILLPRGQLPLNIFEPRYLNLIDDAMAGDRLIGMVQTQGAQKGGGMATERPSLAAVGCVGRLTAFAESSDGRYLITLSGVCRFALGRELPASTPYRQVEADFSSYEADLANPEEPVGFDRKLLLEALRLYLDSRGLGLEWDAAEQAPLEALTNSLSAALPFDPQEKQMLLQAETLDQRLSVLAALLTIGAAGSDDDDPPPMQ